MNTDAATPAVRAVKRGVINPRVQIAMRFGYVVRGVLYAVVGFLALQLALGFHLTTSDQRGTLFLLTSGPLRPLILLLIVAGLGSYALWGFVRAIFDPLRRGDDAMGIVARLGFAWSGFNYACLTVVGVLFLTGTVSGDGRGTLRTTLGIVSSWPAGNFLVAGAGVIAIATGLGQFGDALMASFKKDLKRNRMSRQQRLTVDNLGRAGMVARGITFTMLGWFILLAGIHNDVSTAKSMADVFESLAASTNGRIVLGITGLGFVALALHSCACARWVRMPRTAQ